MATKEASIYGGEGSKMESIDTHEGRVHFNDEDEVIDGSSCGGGYQSGNGDVSEDEVAADVSPFCHRGTDSEACETEYEYPHWFGETVAPRISTAPVVMAPCSVGTTMPSTHMHNAAEALQTIQPGDFGVVASMPITDMYYFADASRITQPVGGWVIMTAPYASYDSFGLNAPQEIMDAQQKEIFSDSQLAEASTTDMMCNIPNDTHAQLWDLLGWTTVMMRNIPNNLTRAQLRDLLEKKGFLHFFDFLYLPVDFKKKANLGYAHLNLVSVQQAHRFFEAFIGFEDWHLVLEREGPVTSGKVCEVSWSKCQGLDANVTRHRNSPVMREPDEYRPVLFRDGQRVKFPRPTKRSRAPQRRNSK